MRVTSTVVLYLASFSVRSFFLILFWVFVGVGFLFGFFFFFGLEGNIFRVWPGCEKHAKKHKGVL